MRKSRFTEEQKIGMIKEHEAGVPTIEICRNHGLSVATVYSSESSPAAWMYPMPASLLKASMAAYAMNV